MPPAQPLSPAQPLPRPNSAPNPFRWMANWPIRSKQLAALISTEVLSLSLVAGSVWLSSISLQEQLFNQAKSEVAVSEINYYIKVNQMGFGFRGQSDNPAIIAAAKANSTQQPLTADQFEQVRRILQNEIRARRIEYATLVGTDRRIIVNANSNRQGQSFDPQGLVSQVLSNPRQIKADGVVSLTELQQEGSPLPEGLEAQGNLIRYTVTPVRDPETRAPLGVLVSGDIVDGKTPIVQNTVKALQGGYSAVYFSQANRFELATSMIQTEGSDQLQPNLTLPDTPEAQAFLAEALQAPEGATTRLLVGGQWFTVAARSLPSLQNETDTGPVAVKESPRLTVLVRGTPETALNTLLQSTQSKIIFSGALVLILDILLGSLLGRVVVRPIRELGKVAQSFAQGDRRIRAKIYHQDEVGELTRIFNQMADSLEANEAQILSETSRTAEARQQLEEESILLQEDVGHILDIVSAIETGDLTVTAEVNDRATGLVSDTLNRLIEALARILATVVTTAQQVTVRAAEVENLAVATAQQALQQAHAVAGVESLVADVTQLSQQNAHQSQIATQSVGLTQEAVFQGQVGMNTMTSRMLSLQEGSDQINRRVETLSDFVQLAAQFTRDQKRIATQTRVLAMNASMLATRASGQQDPEQFASLSREFETIAGQVNDLAVQTSQSLVVLQQRTDLIQTVVSGMTQDAQDIHQLVEQFTNTVSQSRQVFENIRAALAQVVQVGQEVNQSSQTIAQSAQTTLSALATITTLATETEHQATSTRQQITAMSTMTNRLLELISLFQLPRGIQTEIPVVPPVPVPVEPSLASQPLLSPALPKR